MSFGFDYISAWNACKGGYIKGFSLCFSDEDNLLYFSLYVLRENSKDMLTFSSNYYPTEQSRDHLSYLLGFLPIALNKRIEEIDIKIDAVTLFFENGSELILMSCKPKKDKNV